MATATQTAPATVRPIPLAAKEVPTLIEEENLKNCKGHFGTCRWAFKIGSGFVPDLTTLYEQVRGIAVNPRYPLTQSEVLSQELCRSCSHDHRFMKFGMRTFPTQATFQRADANRIAYASMIPATRTTAGQPRRLAAATSSIASAGCSSGLSIVDDGSGAGSFESLKIAGGGVMTAAKPLPAIASWTMTASTASSTTRAMMMRRMAICS